MQCQLRSIEWESMPSANLDVEDSLMVPNERCVNQDIGTSVSFFYKGHIKRVYALKYQSIVTPDGLIAHLYGPIEGRREDSGI